MNQPPVHRGKAPELVLYDLTIIRALQPRIWSPTRRPGRVTLPHDHTTKLSRTETDQPMSKSSFRTRRPTKTRPRVRALLC